MGSKPPSSFRLQEAQLCSEPVVCEDCLAFLGQCRGCSWMQFFFPRVLVWSASPAWSIKEFISIFLFQVDTGLVIHMHKLLESPVSDSKIFFFSIKLKITHNPSGAYSVKKIATFLNCHGKEDIIVFC